MSNIFTKEKNPNWNSVEKICELCGKKMYVSPSRKKRRFCSKKCRKEWTKNWLSERKGKLHPNWKGGLISKECAKCGKIIPKKPGLINKRTFCSKTCANSITAQERPKERIKRTCACCGNIFEIHPNKLNRKDRKQGLCCSIRCRSIDHVKKQRKKDTDIEKIIEGWLIENRVAYKAQYPIKGISLVDFYVAPDIIIFCDGDYWHSLNEVKKRDRIINSDLKQLGYRVYRLSGSGIKKGVRPHEIL